MCFYQNKNKLINEKIRCFIKNIHFFSFLVQIIIVFSNIFYDFCCFLYSINYVVNGKTILLLKKPIT